MNGRFLFAAILAVLFAGCESYHDRMQASVGKPDGGNAARVASSADPNLSSLRVGSPCRINLVSPPGKGQAYEGTVVRMEPDAVVLGNAISEGPVKRPPSKDLKDLVRTRAPWTPAEETIDSQRVPDKEVRIAKSQIASASVLDHDPLADFYRR